MNEKRKWCFYSFFSNPFHSKFVGANEIDGVLMFNVKFKGVNDCKWVQAKLLHDEFLQLVINFYESNLVWGDQAPINE